MPGTLYLCATPIGNLEDITLRALRVLQEVDLIAAEDTRDTRKLATHFRITTPLVSFHQHSRAPRIAWILEQLQAGKSVALVSSAGTPIISDPGAELVRRCAELGLSVVPLPGASAVLAALAASGCDGQRFLFAGFLPKKSAARRRELEQLRGRAETLVFFESPERIVAFLRDAATTLGDRPAAVARELTKKFEEVMRGSLHDLVVQWEARDARGEFTVVIAGADLSIMDAGAGMPAALQRYDELIAENAERSAALRHAALECNVPRNELYAALLARGHGTIGLG